jgi:hypothetical protein
MRLLSGCLACRDRRKNRTPETGVACTKEEDLSDFGGSIYPILPKIGRGIQFTMTRKVFSDIGFRMLLELASTAPPSPFILH